MSFAEAKMIGEQEVARRKQRGITDTADIIPHPDHIHVDPRTMAVEVRGPMSEEERTWWLECRAAYEHLAEVSAATREAVAAEPDPVLRARQQSFLRELDVQLTEEKAQLPDWWHVTE